MRLPPGVRRPDSSASRAVAMAVGSLCRAFSCVSQCRACWCVDIRLKKEASAPPVWACARWRSLLLKNGTVTLWASFLYCALCCGATSPAWFALFAFELSCGCVGRLVGCAVAPLSVSLDTRSLPRAATFRVPAGVGVVASDVSIRCASVAERRCTLEWPLVLCDCALAVP